MHECRKEEGRERGEGKETGKEGGRGRRRKEGVGSLIEPQQSYTIKGQRP